MDGSCRLARCCSRAVAAAALHVACRHGDRVKERLGFQGLVGSAYGFRGLNGDACVFQGLDGAAYGFQGLVRLLTGVRVGTGLPMGGKGTRSVDICFKFRKSKP